MTDISIADDVILPPSTAELAKLVERELAELPFLDASEARLVGERVLALLGDDFARFRSMYLAASVVDPVRFLAFEEYLRRRAAMAGRGLGPDEVAVTMTDFERLPAAYIAELAAPAPPPMPGNAIMAAGVIAGGSAARPLKLFPDWSDIKYELFKGGSILGVAAMAIISWQASNSMEVGGLLLVAGMALVLYFFRRRGS